MSDEEIKVKLEQINNGEHLSSDEDMALDAEVSNLIDLKERGEISQKQSDLLDLYIWLYLTFLLYFLSFQD